MTSNIVLTQASAPLHPPEVALSFMVQEPRGIMEWHSDRSLFSRRFR